MATKYILAILACIFFVAAVVRFRRDDALGPQSRTWFLISAIFAAVSAWLWFGV